MRGIGYRTVAARAQSGRALKAGVAGIAIAALADFISFGGGTDDGPDEGYAGGESPGRLNEAGLAAVAGGVYGVAAIADALGVPKPAFRGVRALAGFAGRGGPAGFIGGALMGYLMAYLAYYMANRGPGQSLSFPGFTHVLSCEQQNPVVRYTLGDPGACNILVPAEPPIGRNLGDPYTAGELATGFQTMWEHVPGVDRYATVDKYQVDGAATGLAPQRPDRETYSDEQMAALYEALQNATVNPWPEEDGEQVRPVPGILPKPIDGFKPAIPPNLDAEALPYGTMAPNPNTLRMPYRVVTSRKDAGNPFRVPGYRWEAGPRPGEFPVPVGLPSIKVPAVTVDRDGRQTPDRVYPNLRAAARTHERKVKAPSQGAAQTAYMQMFGGMTEIGEFIDAIYDALPTKIRMDDYFANGRHELGRDKKLWSIYQNYKAINVDTMVKNIVFNNLQDALIGKASRDITSASGGSPIGRTLGLF